MKDQNKQIEMALLEQLCKLVDSSAMEGYHAKSGKLEPEYAENKAEVYATGAGEAKEKNWGWSKEDLYEDDSEAETDEHGDDTMAKLRKLEKEKNKKEPNTGNPEYHSKRY